MLFLAESSGLNPAALKVESTTNHGVVIQAKQTSSDATLLLSIYGSEDIIKAFGPAEATEVFNVNNAGDVNANSFITSMMLLV